MSGKILGTMLFAALTMAAPRVAAPQFQGSDETGAAIRLADYRGKVVLLNFWATWCGGCKHEIPWLMEYESKYKSQGLRIIGASMDDEGWSVLKPFLTKRQLNYPVILGSASLARKYDVGGLPRTVLIDREGRIAASQNGVIDRVSFDRQIQALLKETAR